MQTYFSSKGQQIFIVTNFNAFYGDKMVEVRRKKVSFWAKVPSKRRGRVTFNSGGRTVSFLASKRRKKKITFYARR